MNRWEPTISIADADADAANYTCAPDLAYENDLPNSALNVLPHFAGIAR